MINKTFIQSLRENALEATKILIDATGKLNISFIDCQMVIESIHEFLDNSIELILLKNSRSQLDVINSKLDSINLTINVDNLIATTSITVSQVIPTDDDVILVVDSYGDVNVTNKPPEATDEPSVSIPSLFDDIFSGVNWTKFFPTFPFPSSLIPEGCKGYSMTYKLNDDGTLTFTSDVDGKKSTKTFKLQEV